MKNKGFTLIELLVVIAILALLASIIFASLSNARDKANVRKAQVQAGEIEKAIELSRLSNGNLPFSNIDPTVSIKDDPDTLSAIEEYYPSISSITLPEGKYFEGGEYYAFSENNSATINFSSINYPATCKPDYLAVDGMSQDDWITYSFEQTGENPEDLYDEFTAGWESDDYVVVYKDRYANFDGGLYGCFEWGILPGFDSREKVEDRNIVYINNNGNWEPIEGCQVNWICES